MSSSTAHSGKRGRPKGTRNVRTIIHALAREQIIMQEGDQTQAVTIAEALLLKARQLAMVGDIPLDKELDKLRQQLAPTVEEPGTYLIAPEPITTEAWVRRADIANRFSKAPEGLPIRPPSIRLSPGAVDQPVQQPGPKSAGRQFMPNPAAQSRLIR